MKQNKACGSQAQQMAALLLITLCFASSAYAVSVASPVKLQAIGAGSYYALTAAVTTIGMMLALPVVGKLARRFGSRDLAIAGMTLQLLLRVWMAFSPSVWGFTAAGTLANLAGGLYVSLPYSIAAGLGAPQQRAGRFGLITTFHALGALAGPLLAGWLTGKGWYQAALLMHAPLVLAACILLRCWVPNRTDRGVRFRGDLRTLALLLAGVGGTVLCVSLSGKLFAWRSLPAAALLFAGLAGLYGLWRTSRGADSLVPVGLFRNRRFGGTFAVMLLMSAYNTSLAGFGIVYVQQVMQAGAQLSATVTLPQTLVQTVFGVLLGRYLAKGFVQRFRRVGVLTPVLTTAAMLILTLLQPASSMLQIYAAAVLGGLGTTIAQTAFAPFFQSGLPEGQLTRAQSMFSLSSNAGSCLFAALVSALLNGGLTYNHVFATGTGLGVLACALALAVFRFPAEEIQTDQEETI